MLKTILEKTADWMGGILGSLFIVCGFVFFCFLFGASSDSSDCRRDSPCYRSIIQMIVGSVSFFTLGIKCLDAFFFKDLEDGVLIVDRIASLMFILVLMSLAVSLLMFEVKNIIGKHQDGGEK